MLYLHLHSTCQDWWAIPNGHYLATGPAKLLSQPAILQVRKSLVTSAWAFVQSSISADLGGCGGPSYPCDPWVNLKGTQEVCSGCTSVEEKLRVKYSYGIEDLAMVSLLIVSLTTGVEK